MERDKSSSGILKILLKGFSSKPTVTSLAEETGLSRVGVWKVLKKMQSERLIALSKIGSGKTSAYIISLNWDNPIAGKKTELCLIEESLKNQRWIDNFEELKNKVDFLILYGSIIKSPQEANDIDILGIVSNKKKFIEIEKNIRDIQKAQIKKIHPINFTPAEFRHELEKPNKSFIDAVRKGVVLFGQEKFIKFIRGMAKNEL